MPTPDPINLRGTSDPICPHCGAKFLDPEELDFGGTEGETQVTCGDCAGGYAIHRYVSVSYSTAHLRRE